MAYPDFFGPIALFFVTSVLLGIDILSALFFLYRNKNRRNSPKRMHPNIGTEKSAARGPEHPAGELHRLRTDCCTCQHLW